jgi:integrase
MERKNLTDRYIRSLTPTERGEILDIIVPGLALRVSPTSKTFVLIHRFPGSRNPTRRSLGRYGALTLQDARIKARRWLEMIEHGKDPAIELERERLAEARKRADTFSAVARAFTEQKLSKERQGYDAGRLLQRFIEAWGDRPIVDIERRDIRAIIDPIAARAPYTAHYALGVIRRFFSWCVDRDILQHSPCEGLRASAIIGKRKPRQRVLSEDEIIALHQAASELPYPHGPLLRFLLLSGQRHMDCAHATWNEISLERREWIIPAGRFKSEVSHLVPLSNALVELLSALPRIKGNDRLFPLSRGIVDEAKAHLDARLLEILKARNPGAKLERWVIHDIRRSFRTRLTQLRIQTEVAEATIGHGKRGLERHYNLFEYADEKRHALELWASWLRNLVEPPVLNVLLLSARQDAAS